MVNKSYHNTIKATDITLLSIIIIVFASVILYLLSIEKLALDFKYDIQITEIINQVFPQQKREICNHGQDSAIYENFLFDFEGDSGLYHVYDIETGLIIASNKILGTVDQIRPHVNSAIFGSKLDEDDAFPLLYVSGYNGLSESGIELSHGCGYVYRIDDDFNATLMQTIIIDFTENNIWKNTETRLGAIGYGNFIVDENFLYVLTSRNSKTRIFKFDIPNIYVDVVTLSVADIVEYYDLPFYPYMQGMTISENYLFVLNGINYILANSSSLQVIDLSTCTQVGVYSLSAYMDEPEAIVAYNNRLYVAQSIYYEVPVDFVVNWYNGILPEFAVLSNHRVNIANKGAENTFPQGDGIFGSIFTTSTNASSYIRNREFNIRRRR